jgi:hypothetical protein
MGGKLLFRVWGRDNKGSFEGYVDADGLTKHGKEE